MTHRLFLYAALWFFGEAIAGMSPSGTIIGSLTYQFLGGSIVGAASVLFGLALNRR